MIINNEAALLNHLKGAPASCYYFYGENDYLVRQYARRLAERVCGGDFSEWVYQKFDFSRAAMDDVVNAAMAVSFTGSGKCLFFPAFKASELSPEDNMRLIDLIPDIPEGVTLIMEGLEAPKKQGKRSLYSEVDKHGVIVELSAHDRNDLVKFCQRIASHGGANIRTATCDYLFQRVTDNMESLSNEMAKLVSYVGKQEILPEHINLLCAEKLDQSVFDIVRAILRKDLTTAFARLESLRLRQESPISALGAMESAFLDLYRVKLAENRRIPLSKVASDFGYRGPADFRITRASGDSRPLTLNYLRACVDLLLEADQNCKTLRTDKYELLEQTVVRLLDARRTAV